MGLLGGSDEPELGGVQRLACADALDLTRKLRVRCSPVRKPLQPPIALEETRGPCPGLAAGMSRPRPLREASPKSLSPLSPDTPAAPRAWRALPPVLTLAPGLRLPALTLRPARPLGLVSLGAFTFCSVTSACRP